MTTPRPRRAARFLVTNRAGEVLLFRFRRRDGSLFWATPGGGLEEGEDHAAAARREAKEELDLDLADPGPVVWTRTARFTLATMGNVPVLQEEVYFRIPLETWAPTAAVAGFHEEEGIEEARYWSGAEIARGQGDGSVEIFPEGLGAFLTSPPR